MNKRSKFPPVFWIANSVEVLERFSYYGIYLTFYAYLQYRGYSRGDLGIIQSIFLFISYFVPVFSGTLADRYGFKKVLIISYLAYIPSILLLMVTKSFSGIALTMLSIGFAAGIFKPLISGTVRLTTDSTNKTIGFGIFYMMVNIGGTFGPIVAGKLRAISWNHAFLMAAISITVMLLITVFFYKEPPKEVEQVNVGKKLKEIFSTVTDKKFAIFIVILGLFFWLPFWGFFNICGAYIDNHLNTVRLFNSLENVLGTGIAKFLSRQQDGGVWRINGEAIANTGWIIIILQLLVSRIFEKRKALPSFMLGLFVAACGYLLIGYSIHIEPAYVILGIVIFAIGEMISSPRIQEYITWIAPKEKAGLYMGSNFLATCIGALLSGVTYTKLFGHFETKNIPEYIWYVLALNLIAGVLVMYIFTRTLGDFKEQES